jgi:hypothetical protein
VSARLQGRRRVAVSAVLVGAMLGSGCATGAPQLLRLTPAAGDPTRGAPVEVLVEGRGFAAANTVRFGELEFRQVPRLSSTRLRFQVPSDDAARPGRGEAPPGPLATGRYEVTVTTPRGTSNALPFQLQGVVR